ncbi:MAG: hypothetical protein AB1540_08755 [Bdellovibrionota bacterium]
MSAFEPLKLHLIARLAAVFIFLAAFFLRAGDFLIADEIDFAKPLAKWVTDGPQREGLWHSPFYPWLVSNLGRWFGFTPAVKHSIGFFTIIVTAMFLYRAALAVRPRLEEWKRTALIVIGLLFPVSLSSSLLLDYDTTLLMAATAGYFYLIASHYSDSGNRKKPVGDFSKIAVLGSSLGLCLMAKETTPLVYPLAIFVAEWRRSSFVRGLFLSVCSAVWGIFFFLGAAWSWCQYYALPLSAVFEMDLLGLKIHGGAAAPWAVLSMQASLWVKSFPVIWVGPPLLVLFVAYLPRFFRGNGATGGITAVIVAVLLAYTFVLRQMTYYHPKYMAPVLPWLAWLCILELPSKLEASRSSLLGWMAGIFAWFLVLSSPLEVLYSRHLTALLQSLMIFLGPLAFWVVFRFSSQVKKRSVIPNASMMVLFLTLGLCASYAKSALFSGRSITYWYGEQAISEAVAIAKKWQANYPDGALYAPAKDIAWATRSLNGVELPKDELAAQSSRLCGKKDPFLIITRVREDSSLISGRGLERLRTCLKHVQIGKDIVWAANRSF